MPNCSSTGVALHCIFLENVIMTTNTLKKYLVALPCSRGEKGFNHPTVLVSAKSETDAKNIVRHIRPNSHIGDVKIVNY